jgi:hypothetical protein
MKKISQKTADEVAAIDRPKKKRLAKFVALGAVSLAAPLALSSSASALPAGYNCSVSFGSFYNCSHNGVTNTVNYTGSTGSFNGVNFRWTQLTVASSGARSFNLYEKVNGSWALVKTFVFCTSSGLCS